MEHRHEGLVALLVCYALLTMLLYAYAYFCSICLFVDSEVASIGMKACPLSCLLHCAGIVCYAMLCPCIRLLLLY